jgi:hypothetical protein
MEKQLMKRHRDYLDSDYGDPGYDRVDWGLRCKKLSLWIRLERLASEWKRIQRSPFFRPSMRNTIYKSRIDEIKAVAAAHKHLIGSVIKETADDMG